jgi:sugar-specific transcriptional regulator TrmB
LLDQTEITFSAIMTLAELPYDKLWDVLRELEAEGTISVSIKRKG